MKIQNITAAGVLTLAVLISNIGTASAAETRSYKVAMEECFWGLILPNEDQRSLSLGLNVVSGSLGTYAYTSATMSPDSFCAEKTVRTAKFVNENYPRLAEDISRGEGEFLRTAMMLSDCDTSAAQSAVTNDIRQALAADLAHANYSEMQNAEKAVRLYTNLGLSAQSHCVI